MRRLRVTCPAARTALIVGWVSVVGVGCTQTGDDSVDLGDPVQPLVLPDTTGFDFVAATKDAVQLTKTVHAGRAWDAHAAALARASAGCPDYYVGAPDDPAVEVGDGEGGASWFDHCTTSGDIAFDGYQYWEGEVIVDGDPTSDVGATINATRSLTGNGVIGAVDGVHYELDGEATDALNAVTAKGYAHWTWSSTMAATLTGADVFGADALAPGGWRTDLALYATGGDASAYEARGNVYLFDERLQDHFDSVEVDVAFLGPGAAGPDDCALEPRGWVGLRDENAYWYDLVFLPRYDQDPTDTGSADTYGTCDGCGTLYVRGVEATELGQVCVDFSFLWSDTPLVPPDVSDYILSLHVLESEAP